MAENSAMTITEFLEARIAEDEAQAEYVQSYGDCMTPTGGYALFTPHRALVECTAKRAIIEQAQKASELEEEFDEYMWAGAGPEQVDLSTGDAILFALASVYKDHPDYRQEWSV